MESKHTPETISKGAIISECKRYRFQLWRIWDESKPLVLWKMHNPSTADENTDDPTIRRIINFSSQWGYGGIYVGNLYPYRVTDPKELVKLPFNEIWTPQNITHINEMAAKCSLHMLAYGNPAIKNTTPTTPELFDDRWHYLKLTKLGNPCHPLYLKSDLKPIPMNVAKGGKQ